MKEFSEFGPAERLEYFKFGAALNRHAEKKYSASIPESFAFTLYQEYCSADKPPLKKWIGHRLEGEFCWIDTPPKWIDEPNWPYAAGRPMVFLGQTELPKTDVTERFLTWHRVEYLFSLTIAGRLEYRLIAQDRGIHGRGLR